MKTRLPATWKTLGLLACTLALAASLHAQSSVKVITTDPTALEGTSTGSFTLIRTGDTNSDLAVNVSLSGTASNGVDYTAISSPIVIPAGYLAVDVLVQPIIDTAVRGNKTVILSLQSGDSYTLAGRGYGTVKIVDDVFDVPPPTVTLTSPADGSVFTTPAVVTLSADVDSELPIQRVGFYVDDRLVSTVTNTPYTYTWSSSDNGKHTVFARAVDEADKAGVSDTAHVTLSATPVVTLVSEFGNEVYDDQQVPLEAVIGDPNETIQSVSFYVNKKLVGTVTTAPFVFYWSDNTDGTFNLTAIATDANTGKTGTSAKVAVTVIPQVVGGD
jgi:hypothetical protein